jgi:hypothetical protein
LAYTVDDAIAAVASAQAAEQNFNTFWFIQGSVTITDTPPEQLFAHPDPDFPTHITDEGTVELVADEEWAPITGNGPLFRGLGLLGNLELTPIWQADKFKCQRGGGPEFYLGLNIEQVITIGPLSIPPPAFARSFVQRHAFLTRKRYRGVWALQSWLRFSVPLTEDPVGPKLTGSITPDPSLPGAIHPPATIEVVLESLASFTVQ